VSSPLPKSLRFEVLKRDKFACQYCGGKAPEVLLQVDHIHPESKGGKHDVLNLITSCQPCNSGKSDKLLSDNAAIEKKRGQLEEFQERKEQIEMMAEWQIGLADLDGQTVDAVVQVVRRLTPGWVISEAGRADVRKHLAKYGMEAVCAEFRKSAAQHVVLDADGLSTKESAQKTHDVALNALKWKAHNERDPVGSQARYLRAIMRNRWPYVSEWEALALLKDALQLGFTFESLKTMICRHSSWTSWRAVMREQIAEETGKPG
jgi:hypothetical protein